MNALEYFPKKTIDEMRENYKSISRDVKFAYAKDKSILTGIFALDTAIVTFDLVDAILSAKNYVSDIDLLIFDNEETNEKSAFSFSTYTKMLKVALGPNEEFIEKLFLKKSEAKKHFDGEIEYYVISKDLFLCAAYPNIYFSTFLSEDESIFKEANNFAVEIVELQRNRKIEKINGKEYEINSNLALAALIYGYDELLKKCVPQSIFEMKDELRNECISKYHGKTFDQIALGK